MTAIVRHGTEQAKATPPATTDQERNKPALAARPSLEEQLSDAAHERVIARQQIAERDKALAELRQQLARQSADINRMKEAQDRLESELRSGQAGKEDLLQQRAELGQKLGAAQGESRALQQQVASLAQQSSEETAHAKALEAKVGELTQLLHDRDASLSHPVRPSSGSEPQFRARLCPEAGLRACGTSPAAPPSMLPVANFCSKTICAGDAVAIANTCCNSVGRRTAPKANTSLPMASFGGAKTGNLEQRAVIGHASRWFSPDLETVPFGPIVRRIKISSCSRP